jgi:hypothetical protein
MRAQFRWETTGQFCVVDRPQITWRKHRFDDIFAGMQFVPVTARRQGNAEPPAMFCDRHVGNPDVFSDPSHWFGPDKLVELFACKPEGHRAPPTSAAGNIDFFWKEKFVFGAPIQAPVE